MHCIQKLVCTLLLSRILDVLLDGCFCCSLLYGLMSLCIQTSYNLITILIYVTLCKVAGLYSCSRSVLFFNDVFPVRRVLDEFL